MSRSSHVCLKLMSKENNESWWCGTPRWTYPGRICLRGTGRPWVACLLSQAALVAAICPTPNKNYGAMFITTRRQAYLISGMLLVYHYMLSFDISTFHLVFCFGWILTWVPTPCIRSPITGADPENLKGESWEIIILAFNKTTPTFKFIHAIMPLKRHKASPQIPLLLMKLNKNK